jgi:hypothetical protein
MALMTITEFREMFSPGSRPDRRTVIGWIKSGELAGRRLGGQWYIDPDIDPPARVPVDKPAPEADAIQRRAAEILASS